MFAINEISFEEYLKMNEEVRNENKDAFIDDSIIIEKLEKNSIIIGLAGIEDIVKPKVINCLQEFEKANIQTIICTGDGYN